MIGHLLGRELAVWRPTRTPDGYGGHTTELVQQPDTVAAKVEPPSATERMVAAQARSEHTHNVYLLLTADVRRGDELRGDGQSFRVLDVGEPSSPVYRKAQTQLIQSEGEPNG
jgi:SPP1 family predicted phage head-tail adaptor